jgi:hypothetical protein
MGYQQWTTGQVLTSTAMNQVGDSTVNVFADSSARSTAITSPSEGMVSYLSDTNQIEIYTGAAWAGIGDITEVAAGANIDVTSGTGPVPSVALAIDAAVSFGVDGTGVDTTWHSGTASDNMAWSESNVCLTITGTNGQDSLTVADGDVSITDALTVTGAVTAGSLVAPLAINAQTGTTYTFVIGDAGKLVTSSNGSAQTITVPPNSGVAFAVGTQIIVQNIGSANATIATAGTPTINSKDANLEIDGQFAAATLIKTATDVWSLIGALA